MNEYKPDILQVRDPVTGEFVPIAAIKGDKGDVGPEGKQGPKGDPGEVTQADFDREIASLSEQIVQSDWAENDPQNPAYVKNRIGGYAKPVPGIKLYKNEYLRESYKGQLSGTEPAPQRLIYYFRSNALYPPYIFNDPPVLTIDDITFDFALAKKYDARTPNSFWFLYGNPHYLLPNERQQIVNPPEDVDNGEEYLYVWYGMSVIGEIANYGYVERRRILGDKEPQVANFLVTGTVPKDVEIDVKYLPFKGTTDDDGNEIFNNNSNSASGGDSHAEGQGTVASGMYSHAECKGTTASGFGSHAEGYAATASGEHSHAECRETIASGDQSHAEGFRTVSAGDNQHVQGKNNIPDTVDGTFEGTPNNKYAHIVGNGEGYGDNKYSNAHTLDWEGNSWYQGSVLVGGEDMDAPDAELNPTSVVIKSSTPGSAKRFRITVDDSGAIKAEEIIPTV